MSVARPRARRKRLKPRRVLPVDLFRPGNPWTPTEDELWPDLKDVSRTPLDGMSDFQIMTLPYRTVLTWAKKEPYRQQWRLERVQRLNGFHKGWIKHQMIDRPSNNSYLKQRK